tara:strand:+ start:895 stop:1077 length:183 start_codon:yes stop_codon:yes gene_type:complete
MNEVRIKELESIKKEAKEKVAYLEYYCSGRNFCDVVLEHKLIEGNKQVIINIDSLISKLN